MSEALEVLDLLEEQEISEKSKKWSIGQDLWLKYIELNGYTP